MTDKHVHGMELTTEFVPRVNIFAMRDIKANIEPQAAPLILIYKRRPKTLNLDTETEACRKACIAFEHTARTKLAR